jgi:hypothetical protein
VAGARCGAGAHAVGAREPPSRRRRGRGPARGAQRAGDRHRRPANRHDARHAEDARMASGRRGGVPAGLRDHPQLLPIACVDLQRPLRPQPWGPATAAGRQPRPQLHAAAALEGQRLLHGDGRKVPQPVESRNPTAVLRPLRGRQRRVQQRQLGRRRRGPADPGLHHHDHRRQGDRVPERLRGRRRCPAVVRLPGHLRAAPATHTGAAIRRHHLRFLGGQPGGQRERGRQAPVRPLAPDGNRRCHPAGAKPSSSAR